MHPKTEHPDSVVNIRRPLWSACLLPALFIGHCSVFASSRPSTCASVSVESCGSDQAQTSSFGGDVTFRVSQPPSASQVTIPPVNETVKRLNGKGRQHAGDFQALRLSDPFRLSTDGSDRATAYNGVNKIVSVGDKTHVVWLDQEGSLFYVRIATFDRVKKLWSETFTIDEAIDNHGGAAIAADSTGHLHVVYYPHSQHPFRYRRSLAPNDASAWTPVEMFGMNGTYPSIVVLADDTLVMAARQSHWQEPWSVSIYRRPAGGRWTEAQPIVTGNAGQWLKGAHPDYYSSIFFQSLAVGIDGRTVHLTLAIAEPAFGNLQDRRGYVVGYVYSRDGGNTWRGKANKIYKTPIAPQQLDIVDGTALPKHDTTDFFVGNVSVDPKGKPWVMYCRLDRRPYDTFLAVRDAHGRWRKIRLLPVIRREYPTLEPTIPGAATFDAKGNLYVVLTLTDRSAKGQYPYWVHATNRVLVLVSADFGRNFDMRLLSGKAGTIDWLPSIEMATSTPVAGAPGVIFTRSVLDPSVPYRTVSNHVYFLGLSK